MNIKVPGEGGTLEWAKLPVLILTKCIAGLATFWASAPRTGVLKVGRDEFGCTNGGIEELPVVTVVLCCWLNDVGFVTAAGIRFLRALAVKRD